VKLTTHLSAVPRLICTEPHVFMAWRHMSEGSIFWRLSHALGDPNSQVSGSVSACERECVTHVHFHLVKPRSAFAGCIPRRTKVSRGSATCCYVVSPFLQVLCFFFFFFLCSSSYCYIVIFTFPYSSAMLRNRRLLTAENRIRSQGSPREICGGQRGTGTHFSPRTSGFPCLSSFYQCSILMSSKDGKIDPSEAVVPRVYC